MFGQLLPENSTLIAVKTSSSICLRSPDVYFPSSFSPKMVAHACVDVNVINCTIGMRGVQKEAFRTTFLTM
jgi:hypothetical protein